MDVEGEPSRKRLGTAKAVEPTKKTRLVSRKKKAGFDEEIFKETTYYIRDGLRYVKPYYFTFTSYAKGRWVGSTLYDVFCREFQAESPEYYERAIKTDKVTVNGRNAEMDTVISHNDLICHHVHRHEPPVTAQPLSIIHMDKDLVVINKPPSIPIHPCGRYRHNSVVFLLGKEHNLKNLHTVHRLDRLTSGLLILARSIQRAQQLEVEIRERKVAKEYVCRVQGEFPVSCIECDQPILVFYHKLGLSRVDPVGKPCTTRFTRLSYNGETSVVKCEPRTGRMHQIRVHLQWLGHPIANDPLYNHPAWKCDTAGEGVARGVAEHHVTAEGDRVREGGRMEGGGGSTLLSRPDLDKIVTDIISSRFSETVATLPPVLNSVEEGKEEERREEREEEGREVKREEEGEEGRRKEGREEREEEGREEGREETGEEERRVKEQKVEVEERRGDKAEDTRHHRDNDTDRHHRDISPAICTEMKTVDDPSSPPVPHPSSPLPVPTTYDPDCTECRLSRPAPSQDQLVMYLHALTYKGESWSFATPLPPWADPDWKKPTHKQD